jgi:4-alpha-glucanotransferase
LAIVDQLENERIVLGESITKNDDFEKNSSPLRDLADLSGVSTSYIDSGRKQVLVDDNSIKQVLSILGVECNSDQEITDSIKRLENEKWLHPIKDTVVEIKGYRSEVDLFLPSAILKNIENIKIKIHFEEGLPEDDLIKGESVVVVSNISESLEEKAIDGVQFEHRVFRLSSQIPLGYHTIVLELPGKASESSVDKIYHRSHLIVTPESAPVPPRQFYGFMSQFYSLRSKSSWGVGDFEDLRFMAATLKEQTGADFLLINPTHADSPTLPQTPSPYLPVSKRWLNPLYINPEIISEYVLLDDDEFHDLQLMISRLSKMGNALNNQISSINRDAVWSLKKIALREIYHATIVENRLEDDRRALFNEFKVESGESLTRFAIWCSLVDDYGFNASFQKLKPNDERIKDYVKENGDNVEFYRWVQWVAQRQLSNVQQEFKQSGAEIGLIADLAVGVHSASADVWSNPDAFVTGATVGAPPDWYNQKGQNWSQPPLSPKNLEKTGYRIFHELVNSIMKNAGAIRIDHMLGLFRFWYVPQNASAKNGAYVKYNHDAMIGILALEAHRNNCYVIGEDMGVIPSGAFKYLKTRGILGTSVLWFERERNGDIRETKNLRERCFSTVTTHDIPPSIGYINGEHIRLRDELGILTEDPKDLFKIHEEDLKKLAKYLTTNKFLDKSDVTNDLEISIALQRSLFDSPSLLLGFSLADFVGEYRAQNQPGTSEEYPNWRVPLEDYDGKLVFNDTIYDNKTFKKFINSIDQIMPKNNEGEK